MVADPAAAAAASASVLAQAGGKVRSGDSCWFVKIRRRVAS